MHVKHCESPSTASPIRIGCAGWGLSANVAARFPARGSHLERYAQIFSSVEINSSFYRSHRPETYARWAASVPDAFRFSVKVPRRITHELRLRDADAPVSDFVQEVTPLGRKLGCLLLQLPPSLAFDEVATRDFFTLMRSLTAAHIVCEPRHATWFTEEGAQTLKSAGIACVRAHPSPIAGVEPVGDPGTLYVRLHGSPEIYYSAYDEAFIEAVAARLLEARSSASEVWCIFDNTARGQAVPNALTLMEKLEGAAC
ncbi:DUF72 domain-containing protein [Paraburkholderia sp. BR14264]|uniref:DUF72 domain-containing protein n=1 Tax=unclassified Paraburkholderia TaxID=2615204 RepID=UPI00397E502F